MDDEFSDTTLASKWSWLNQDSGVWTEYQGRGILETPASLSGDRVRGLIQTAPTGSYTIACKVKALMPLSNFLGAGLLLRDSSTGRLILLQLGRRSTNTYIHFLKMNSPTSWNTDTYLAEWDPNIEYLKLSITGNDIIAMVSLDGSCWTEVSRTTISSFFTSITHIGLHVFRNNNGAQKHYGIFEWFRVEQIT